MSRARRILMDNLIDAMIPHIGKPVDPEALADSICEAMSRTGTQLRAARIYPPVMIEASFSPEEMERLRKRIATAIEKETTK